MQQSAAPPPFWELAGPYATTALAISQPAPILPYEKDAAGNAKKTVPTDAYTSAFTMHSYNTQTTTVASHAAQE